MGNMGSALYKGFIESAASENVSVYCYDKFKPTGTSLETLVKNCKYVVLAVKPQTVDEVLKEIAPMLIPENVIISICAGISAEYIRSRTTVSQKVVCVMPNTPMMLGEGASAVSADDLISPEELDFVCGVIGSPSPAVEVIPPNKMNEIISLNGSSPAFIYLFAKCFIDYAVEQGIECKAALNLFSQSLIGAGKMLSQSDMTVDELIEQVSSKGGTTVAGLEQLRQNGLDDIIKAACKACTARAYELGKLF